VVDVAPGCRFSDNIQAAVDAASDGDILLVKPGTYAGFVIDGKSVHIFGEGSPRVDGNIEVKNVPPDRALVLRNLPLEFSYSSSFSNNASLVWVQGFRSESGLTIDGTELGLFRSVVRNTRVRNGSTLVSYRSTLRGTSGDSGDGYCDGPCFYDWCYYGCDGWQWPGPGGTAVTVSSSGEFFLFGGEVRGGSGGSGNPDPCCSSSDGPGGDALRLNAGTEAVRMNADVIPGTGSPNGQAIVGAGTITSLSGVVCAYNISSPVISGSSATLTLVGPPGWNAFVTYSTECAPVYVPERNGYSMVDPSSDTVFVGQVPLSGTLVFTMPFSLPAGEHAAVLYSQAKFYDTAWGIAYLAEPSAVLVMRDPCP